jgi:hypothetical protein
MLKQGWLSFTRLGRYVQLLWFFAAFEALSLAAHLLGA